MAIAPEAFACPFIDDYLHSLVEAASELASTAAPRRIIPATTRWIAKLRQVAGGGSDSPSDAAWIGSPEEILGQVRRARRTPSAAMSTPRCKSTSNMVPLDDALALDAALRRAGNAALYPRKSNLVAISRYFLKGGGHA